MTTDIARLEREIAAERADLLANLAVLEDRAHALTDWRRQVRNRPLAAVGAAAVGGLLLAMVIDGRPRSAASEDTDGADGSRARLRSHPLIDRIVSALAVVAAERAFAALGLDMPAAADEPVTEHEPRATRGAREPRAGSRDREPRAAGGGGR
ncbi:MAG: hypothetical protein Q8K55_01145 [Gemmatimonadaceae bacterium]|nr:hypothetical protein [Gemmatimonadaceae bacterium]